MLIRPASPDCSAVAHLPTGWHAHQHHDLPAGYRFAVDTFQMGGDVVSIATMCAVDLAGSGAERRARLARYAMPYLHLGARGVKQRGREAVLRLHAQVCEPVRLAALAATAAAQFRLLAGEHALHVASDALDGAEQVHVLQKAGDTVGASVPRAHIVAALGHGFALSDEYDHVGHPLVVLLDGVRTFVAVRPDGAESLRHLAASAGAPAAPAGNAAPALENAFGQCVHPSCGRFTDSAGAGCRAARDNACALP